MRYQSLFSIFLLFIFSHSIQAQSTSFLTNWLNPFKWLTAYSNTSGIVIKPNEEVPVSKIQVLPPLDPLPIPFRMHPMSEKFDKLSNINSMDNIHIPLHVLTPSAVSKQVLSEPAVPQTMNSPSTLPNPRFAPPNLFRKRIGLIPKQETRTEVELADISNSLPTTTDEQLDLTTPIPLLTSDFSTDISSTEGDMSVVSSEKVMSTSELDVEDSSKEVTTISVDEPQPVISGGEDREMSGEATLVPQPDGEFLYEADFAKYLNQFYYSKPTVFQSAIIHEHE